MSGTIKKVIKLDTEDSRQTGEAAQVIAKSCELFIHCLAQVTKQALSCAIQACSALAVHLKHMLILILSLVQKAYQTCRLNKKKTVKTEHFYQVSINVRLPASPVFVYARNLLIHPLRILSKRQAYSLILRRPLKMSHCLSFFSRRCHYPML